MRVFETVQRSYKERVFLKQTCNLCGKATRSRDNWAPESHCIHKITVEAEVGTNYPEGGSRGTRSWVICPDCFEEKIVPLLGTADLEEFDF